MCLSSNPSLMDISWNNSTRFSTLCYFVTAFPIQMNLNTLVLEGYTDVFPKYVQILPDITIIKPTVLIIGIYKKYNLHKVN